MWTSSPKQPLMTGSQLDKELEQICSTSATRYFSFQTLLRLHTGYFVLSSNPSKGELILLTPKRVYGSRTNHIVPCGIWKDHESDYSCGHADTSKLPS